jgi:DNA-binding response OmpR family regulator
MAVIPPKDVLVVEDDEAIRKLILLALGREGLACDSAGGGIPGLEKLNSGSYAVLLLDFMMPGMNGVELLTRYSQLRRPPEEQPIVLLLTAAADRDPLLPVAEVVHAIIKKPFDLHELTEIVCGCVSARRNHRAPVPAEIRFKP